MKFYAQILEVTDSDSVAVNIDTGLDVNVSLTCRLWGVHAKPDTGPDYLRDLLPKDGLVKVHPIRDSRERFGRFQLKIWTPEQELDPESATGKLIYVNELLALSGGYDITDERVLPDDA